MIRKHVTRRGESLTGIRLAIAGGAALMVAVTVLVPARAYPRPGTLERVSVGANGAQSARSALDIGECNEPRTVQPCSASISADGRYVVFSTLADNLVSNDGNHVPDVFLRDRQSGRTELVSVSVTHGGSATVVPLPSGGGLSGGSFEPDVSADGRFVVFASNAVDLVLGTKNPLTYDIFIRDRKLRTTERVSLGSSGLEAVGDSTKPVISADGRYVAFESDAPNLVAGGAPIDTVKSTVHVYEWDRLTKKILRVSVSSQGTPGDARSGSPSITADGRYVAFNSDSTNLDGANRGIFIHDLRNAKTHGAGTLGGGIAGRDAISADGRYVVYYSSVSTLVPHDSGALGGSNIDSFVYDRKTGHTERVSVTSSGAELNEGGVPGTYSEADYPSISADGRFVAFLYSTDLFPIANPNAYVMVHDRLSGSTEVVSLNHTTVVPIDPCEGQDGRQPSNATPPGMAMSSDARYVSFISCLGLVQGDTNKAWDVFVRDRGAVQGVNSLRNIALAVNAGTQPSAAKVVYRPGSNDLLARIDMASMPSFALASPATVYGLDLTVHGVRYQVRAAKVGADAVFGIFRLDPTLGWVHVSSLSGGYGTVAPGVTIAVPLQAIGATGLSDLHDVTAFAGLGSFATGPLGLTSEPT